MLSATNLIFLVAFLLWYSDHPKNHSDHKTILSFSQVLYDIQFLPLMSLEYNVPHSTIIAKPSFIKGSTKYIVIQLWTYANRCYCAQKNFGKIVLYMMMAHHKEPKFLCIVLLIALSSWVCCKYSLNTLMISQWK